MDGVSGDAAVLRRKPTMQFHGEDHVRQLALPQRMVRPETRQGEPKGEWCRPLIERGRGEPRNPVRQGAASTRAGGN